MALSTQQMVLLGLVILVAIHLYRNNWSLTSSAEDEVSSEGSSQEQQQAAPVETVQNGGSIAATAAEVNFGQKGESHSQVDDVPHNTNVIEPAQPSNNFAPQGNFQPNQVPANGSQFPSNMVAPQDLLPVDGCFAASNPPVEGHLTDQNFLTSGHHAGINTQGSSLRNANLQLRSDPLIPRTDVGPWQQSTIESDTNRRPFEIGSC